MSSSGVPSSISAPFTIRVPPSRLTSRTMLKPIGFGRHGERVANTPCSLSCMKGLVTRVTRLTLCRWYTRYTCEKSSMSARPATNSGATMTHPSQSFANIGCIGVASGFVCSVRIIPIDLKIIWLSLINTFFPCVVLFLPIPRQATGDMRHAAVLGGRVSSRAADDSVGSGNQPADHHHFQLLAHVSSFLPHQISIRIPA